MKKINKILITSVSTLAASVALIAPLCAMGNKVVTNNKQQTNKALSASNADYAKVKFQSGTTYTLSGATLVKADVGAPFCSITQPKVIHNDSWKFKGWSKDGTTKISDTFPIPAEGLTLTPLFEEPIDITNCMGISAIEETKVTFHLQAVNVPDLWYSTDYGKNWTQVKASATNEDPSYTMPAGTTIYLKGLNDGTKTGKTTAGFSTGTDNYTYFEFSNNVNIFGNCLALIYDGKEVDKTTSTIPNKYCFYHLFQNCTTIMNISDNFLFVEGKDDGTAGVLKDNCFEGMFLGCTGITQAPRIFAKNAEIKGKTKCFKEIFSGCSKVNYVRVKFSESFEDSDYSANWENWLLGVAGTGRIVYDHAMPVNPGPSTIPENWDNTEVPDEVNVTTSVLDKFICDHQYQLTASVTKSGTPITEQSVYWLSLNPEIVSIEHTTGKFKAKPVTSTTNVKIRVFAKANLNVYKEVTITVNPIVANNCTKIKATEDATFGWTYKGSPIIKTEGSVETEIIPNFRYSDDSGATWKDFVKDNPISIKKDSTILLKGDNPLGLAKGDDAESHTNFTTTSGKITIDGDIKALIYDGRGSSEIGDTPAIPCDYCFQSLFEGNQNITSVASGFLSFTNFNSKTNVYASMFEECQNLEDAPALPASTLADYCYFRMFFNCYKLKATPTLSAETLTHSCYKRMFYGCHAITTTPALPATSPMPYCYYMMFQDCSALTSISKISLQDISGDNGWYCCFQMFAFPNEELMNKIEVIILQSKPQNYICYFTNVGDTHKAGSAGSTYDEPDNYCTTRMLDGYKPILAKWCIRYKS